MSLEYTVQGEEVGKTPSPWARRQAAQAPSDAPHVSRLPETMRITGYSDVQLWRMEKAGRFPKRFKLNPAAGKYGATGHDYHEVMAWLEARRRSRDSAR